MVSAVEDGKILVAAISAIDKMANVMEKLVQRVESLESKLNQQSSTHYACAEKDQSVTMQRRQYKPFWPMQRGPMNQSTFQIMCWKCFRPGHIARNCPENLPASREMNNPQQEATSYWGEDKATKGTNVNYVTKISTLPSDECLKLRCMIGKEPINLLLDTGAPVTLLRRDIWDRVNSKPQNFLLPWEGHRLVGINGSPIQVHGQCMINTNLEGMTSP